MAQKHDHLSISSLFILIISCSGLINASAKLVYEDGYTVTTVVDGNHINLNPYSVLSRPDPLNDLVVLDSTNSLFYTLSLPISRESVPNWFSGKGNAGFSDGDLGAAMFNKPRSFAVDMKGNIYVADRSNLAIRKISGSGVTTIAGGSTTKPGHADGPGKNASFSDDFEITFVPNMCALLVSDHGHKLIRQINLKSEDCSKRSSSGWGISLACTLGLVASCLLSFIVGFAARPYITSVRHPPSLKAEILGTVSSLPSFISEQYLAVITQFSTAKSLLAFSNKICRQEGLRGIRCGETWSRCSLLMLRNQVQMPCFATKSVAASFALLSASKQLLSLAFSHISLLLKVGLEKRSTSSCVVNKEPIVSLIDADSLDHLESLLPGKYEDQLRNLISLDGNSGLMGTSDLVFEQKKDKMTAFSLSDGGRKLDSMVEDNLMSFTENAETSSQLEEDLFVGGPNLMKRR